MKRIGLILTAGVLMSLSSCSLVQQQAPESDSGTAASAEKQEKKATAPKSDKNVQPTPAQMEAAVQVMQENITTAAAAAPESIPDAEPAPQTDVIPGGLRMGRFAPPEEAVSSSDNDMPAPNSVELHGFRSPNLKGGTLPMNINGKINKPE